VTINKQYELKTEPEAGSEPYLQLVGEGDITFDLEQGIPLEMTYKGTVTVNKNKVSVRIPLTLTYKYIDKPTTAPSETTDVKPDVAGQPVKPVARPAPPEPKELTAEELTKLLASLESKNGFERKGALDKLAAAIPTAERREEIAKTIEAYTAHEDGFTRYSALKALGTWGSAENVPAVIEQLKSHDVFTRNNAMETLGKLKDPRAVEPLCEKFKNFHDRREARQALEQLGSMAEKGVIGLLDEQDWNCKMSACQLLAKIGTKESLPALEKATKDSNGLVSGAARSAIDAINNRGDR
jgi:hypothetical protein